MSLPYAYQVVLKNIGKVWMPLKVVSTPSASVTVPASDGTTWNSKTIFDISGTGKVETVLCRVENVSPSRGQIVVYGDNYELMPRSPRGLTVESLYNLNDKPSPIFFVHFTEYDTTNKYYRWLIDYSQGYFYESLKVEAQNRDTVDMVAWADIWYYVLVSSKRLYAKPIVSDEFLALSARDLKALIERRIARVDHLLKSSVLLIVDTEDYDSAVKIGEWLIKNGYAEKYCTEDDPECEGTKYYDYLGIPKPPELA